MRLTSVSITNLAGLPFFEAKLPAVCLLTGKHGAGKSSFQNIVKYAFGRRVLSTSSRGIEHDPSMLHGGAERGEALLSFDEGPIESLRVVVKPDSTERSVKVRGRKAWQAAGSGIDEIASALAYDPMLFQDMEPKQRLEAFLRVVPIEISQEEILEAIGEPVAGLPEKPGLDTLNTLYDNIYKLRTVENVAADTQAKHADQLEAALPPETESGDWNAEVTRLRADKAALDASEAEEMRRIAREFQTAKDDLQRALMVSHLGIDREINEEIAELEAKRSRRKEVVRTEEASKVEVARGKANSEAAEVKTHNAPLHERLISAIATADERARSMAQAEGTRKAALSARAEATDRANKATAMTAALGRLTKLKATVGSRMKISGVTIASPREGMPVDLCREEGDALVPFSRWNSADADAFAIRIAILHRGACGLVCIDNMANWSPARQDAVIRTCRKYAAEGMQFLLGRATDQGELAITDVTQAVEA